MMTQFSILRMLFACCLFTATVPVTAQADDVDADTLAEVFDFLVEPKIPADDVSNRLNECLIPANDPERPHATIILETSFNSEGRPSEPILLVPVTTAADRSHIRQLMRAEDAIFKCAPLITDGALVTDIRLAFKVTGKGFSIAASGDVAPQPKSIEVPVNAAPAPIVPDTPVVVPEPIEVETPEATLHDHQTEDTPVTVAQLPFSDIETRSLAPAPTLPLDLDMPTDALDAAAMVPAELDRSQRRQAQVRLRLAGSNAGGADGVFGPRTREAIENWQQDNDYLVTGELTQTQIEHLWEDTETAYTNWQRKQRAAANARRNTVKYYRGRDGCLRTADRRIVPSQSLKCDAKGLLQVF